MIVREKSKSGVVVSYVNVCYMIEEIISKSSSAEDFEKYMKRTKSGFDWRDAINKSAYFKDEYTSLSMYRDLKSKGRYLTIAKEDLFNKGTNRKFYLFSIECKTRTSIGSMWQLASFQVANPLEKFTSEYKDKLLQEKINNILKDDDRNDDNRNDDNRKDSYGSVYEKKDEEDNARLNYEDISTGKNNDLNKERIDDKKLEELKREVEENFKREVEQAKKEYSDPKKIKSLIRLYAVKDY